MMGGATPPGDAPGDLFGGLGLPFSIVGLGRVGSTLARALEGLGHTVAAVSAPRSEASRVASELVVPTAPRVSVEETVSSGAVVLVAIPDDALAQFFRDAAGWVRPGQIVVHTSGRYGVDVADPIAQKGATPIAMHPAMTFEGLGTDVPRLVGCRFALTAPAVAMPLASALVQSLGGVPVVVAEEARAAYHTALAHSANHLVTLVAQAGEVLARAGIAEVGSEDAQELLRPLLETALTRALRGGMSEITGPVARADVDTVESHLEVLSDCDPGTSNSYRALALATVARLESTGALTTVQAKSLREPLESS